MHDNFQQIAFHISEDVAFVTFEAFVAVRSSFARQDSGFDTLSINGSYGGLRLATTFSTFKLAQSHIIDEAPSAIFDKRPEVEHAYHRQANIKTSCLLQRMEMCDGVTILTTNLPDNLAVADGQPLMRKHLLHGSRRELQKMRRLVNKSDIKIS
jgi:hypothetical protein